MSATVYRYLLRVFLPADAARRYGDDMADLFRVRLAAASGSPLRVLRLWLQAAWDLLRHGTAQRLDPPPDGVPGNTGGSRLRALPGDLRYAMRMLRNQPLFTVIAAGTLALGIGATTVMFSVVDGVLLRPLAYPGSDRLVVLKPLDMSDGTLNVVTTPANFADLGGASALESAATLDGDIAAVTGSGEARRVTGVRSAGSLLEVLGTPPLFGRLLTPEDDLSGERPLVLSHRLWRELYGDDRDILGQALVLDGIPQPIVGVMPADFEVDALTGFDADYWTTSGWSDEYRASITNHAHRVVARLRPGISLAQAEEELRSIAARLRTERPVANRNSDVRLVQLHEDIVADSVDALRLLMGAVGLVLLIATVNIANLLLARATGRGREIAVRKALGATRGQLIQQALVESLVLGALGGSGGLLLATAGLQAMRQSIAWDIPNLAGTSIDVRVLAFTSGVVLLTSLLFGILPALRLTRGDVSGRLRVARGPASESTSTWSALVVAEVALAVVLLVGAGLLLRTFLNLAAVDPGFRTDGLLTFQVAMPPGQDLDERLRLWTRIESELRTIPGIEAATVASQMPAEGNRMSGWFNFVERPVDNTDRDFLVPYRLVSSSYFETLEIPLRSGRSFAIDVPGERTEVVINEAAARRFWGDDNPLGDVIGIGSRTELFLPPATVVGVVGDVHNQGLSDAPDPAVYFPVKDAHGWSNLSFAVEATSDAEVMDVVRDRVARLEPGAVVYNVSTIEEMLGQQLRPTRAVLSLVAGFAAVGLAMAGIGVFGLLSFSVGGRTAEIGLRIALGADGRRLVGLVVGQALWRVLLGTAIGVVAAIAGSRLLANLLFDVETTDPLTLLSVCVALAAIGLLAAWLPARRAASVDPTTALRAS